MALTDTETPRARPSNSRRLQPALLVARADARSLADRQCRRVAGADTGMSRAAGRPLRAGEARGLDRDRVRRPRLYFRFRLEGIPALWRRLRYRAAGRTPGKRPLTQA